MAVLFYYEIILYDNISIKVEAQAKKYFAYKIILT